MKRSRAAVDELSETSKLKILDDEEMQLGTSYVANPLNIDPAVVSSGLVVGPDDKIRTSTTSVITTGAQTFIGVKNFQNGIKLANGSTLAIYRKTTGSTVPVLVVGTITTLTVRGVPAASIPWAVERIGDTVNVSIAEFRITADAGAVGNTQIHLNNLLPVGYRPTSGDYRGSQVLFDNGTASTGGEIDIDTAGSVALINDAAFTLPYGALSDFTFTFSAGAF